MKVLHIVRALDVGGLERVVLDLVEGGRSLGIESHIACLYHAGTWGAGRGDLTVMKGRTKLVKAFQLAKLARTLRIDVLHSHNPEPHLVAVLTRCMTMLPVVNTKHGRNCPERWKWRLQNIWLNRCSAKIVAVSKDIEAVALGPEQTPRGKVCLIHNGIDVGRFESRAEGVERRVSPVESHPPSDLRPPASDLRLLTIGTVGRLRHEKNYMMLIRAFSLLRERLSHDSHPFSSCRLLFVGDGPERHVLEDEAIRVGVFSQCVFAGNQSNVAEWLGMMDIFCLSSLTEGTSITLLEACAAGLPAVVTDVGGNGEIVQDRHSGFLVPEGDENAFTEKLKILVADAGLRGRMGENAHAWVRARYSLEAMVSAYMRVYGESVGGCM